jgi:hypothetical protein
MRAYQETLLAFPLPPSIASIIRSARRPLVPMSPPTTDMSPPAAEEKGKGEMGVVRTAEEVDNTEYPTGFRFWGVVVALVMSTLLARQRGPWSGGDGSCWPNG